MAKKNNAKRTKTAARKTVEALTHDEASRKNIPTAEFQSVVPKDVQQPIRIAYERPVGGEGDPLSAEKAGRSRDLDPQLVWRGKDEPDWSDLVVQAPPLFIQEKIPRRYCSRTSMPTSTACPTRTRRRSSTSTTPTGPTV
jgi:adenine-specific DNA-methyltransferase